MSKAAKESGGKVIFSSKDLPGELSDVLIIKDSIVKDRADEVQGIVDAWYQVQDKYNKDSDSVVDLISPKAELTNDEFYSLLDGIDIATKDYNKEVFANNKDFKATLKEKLTNYHTLISEYEHKEISFLTVDLTEFAQVDFKSWKSAKEHIVDFLFEKLKTFLPVIKSQEWGSIIVLLPDSENIFLSIAVSAAEGMLKSIACELAPENVILNVLKIKGFNPEKTAELAKFFSDSREYLTAQVLCADLTRLPDKLNIQTVSDPVALVKGSGQGIGLAISRELSNLGYRVCANDIKFRDEVLLEIKENNWLNAYGDISIKENTDDMISNICNRYGRLDVLVANAAYMNMTPFADVNINDFEKHLSVNVEGHLNILQQAVELMKKQQMKKMKS